MFRGVYNVEGNPIFLNLGVIDDRLDDGHIEIDDHTCNKYIK